MELRHRRVGQVEEKGVVVVPDPEGAEWPADRKLGQPADWMVQSAEGLGELAEMQLEEGELAEMQLDEGELAEMQLEEGELAEVCWG